MLWWGCCAGLIVMFMAVGVDYCFVYANCVYLISWVCNSWACSVFHGYCSGALDCIEAFDTMLLELPLDEHFFPQVAEKLGKYGKLELATGQEKLWYFGKINHLKA